MYYRVLLAGVAATALLGACDRKPDTPVAPIEAAAPQPVVLAPDTPLALPPAPPARVIAAAPDRADDYWTQAESDDRYYDDRPPSYAYDYGDEAPAVWLDGEMVRRVVERLAGGGERTYYYRAGQDRPYYVQDPYYGYGYEDGSLATVYDVRRRQALDREATRARADEAGRYLARSQALRRAAIQADQRDRRQLDAQQWREWQARQDRPRRPDRPAVQTPPPVVVAPPVRDPRPDRPDRPGRPDRGPDGRPAVVTPPTAPVAKPTAPDAATLEREHEAARRTNRLNREAELKGRREAAAARLRPPQTPTPPVVAPAPRPPIVATPAPKGLTPAQEASVAERRKAAQAAVDVRRAKAIADSEAARLARIKAAADKAAADAARPADK